MPGESTPPETGRVKRVIIKPAQLIADNPAFRVLDRGILARMLGSNFDPEEYDNQIPRIVKVKNTASSTGFTERPVDHHRVYAAAKYQETLEGKDWVAYGLDITAKHVVEGEMYVTDVQHRALVNESEVAHAAFLHDRIAMHFVRDWPDMVGQDVPITALAALSFLSFSSLQDEPLHRLPKTLEKMPPILVNETPEQRERFIGGLVQVAEDMKNVGIKVYSDIGHPVLGVISKEFDRKMIEDQIAGFFAYPSLDAKITADIRPGEVAKRKKKLTKLIGDVMAEPRSVQDSRALYQVLTDSDLSYDDVVTVLGPSEKTLAARYQDFKKPIPLRVRRTPKPDAADALLAAASSSREASESAPVTTIVFSEETPVAEASREATLLFLSDTLTARLMGISTPDEFPPATRDSLQGLNDRLHHLLRGHDANTSVPTSRPDADDSDFPRDWDTIPFNSDLDGKDMVWFNKRLRERTLTRDERHRVTRMIDQAAKKVLTGLPWGEVRSLIGGRGEINGLNAIDAFVTRRFADVAYHCGWSKLSPEFMYLSAVHVARSVARYADAEDNERAREVAERLRTKVVEFTHTNLLQIKPKEYFEALQYLLYNPLELDDPANRSVYSYMRLKSSDVHDLRNRFDALKRKNADMSLEDAFAAIF